MPIPVINVIGFSGSGKTTLLEGLIAWFKDHNYKVATIKHHSKTGLEIDIPGKDSWRHAKAGSDLVVIASPNKLVEYRNLEKEMPLDVVVSRISGVDIIMVEGYKNSGNPSVMVLGNHNHNQTGQYLENCFAIAADSPLPQAFSNGIPQYSRSDVEGLAALIQARFLPGSK